MNSRPRSSTRWSKAPRPILAAVLAILSGACAFPLTSTSNETPSIYLLEWAGSTTPASGRPDGPSLLISSPLSSPGYGSSQMVYVQEPHRLHAFVRHRWADAPARMLTPLLLRAAEQSGLYRAVTTADARVSANLRLDTRLLYLQQVFGADSSVVRLAVRVSLIDVACARLLATRVIGVERPAVERTPYAGVLAANQAVAEFLTQLQSFRAQRGGAAVGAPCP